MRPNYNFKENSPTICFTGEYNDDEDVTFCDKCGMKLIPWNATQLLCQDCQRLFDKNSLLLHGKQFGPVESSGSGSDAEIVPMKDYSSKSKKKPTYLDADDISLKKSGRVFTNVETYWPEGEDR